MANFSQSQDSLYAHQTQPNFFENWPHFLSVYPLRSAEASLKYLIDWEYKMGHAVGVMYLLFLDSCSEA